MLCCSEGGKFSFLELKLVKGKRKVSIDISPHQVAWLSRHAHAHVFIVCRGRNLVLDVFGGSSAVDLRMDSFSTVSPVASFAEPYDWQKFWALTCPV